MNLEEEQKAAAGVLQRRARVMGARAEIARNRALRENKDSRTKKLLDESGGSLTRLRVLVQRQRVLLLPARSRTAAEPPVAFACTCAPWQPGGVSRHRAATA